MSPSERPVNKALAIRQWEQLRDHYRHLMQTGFLEEVEVIPGIKGLEDMVFCANQCLPWITHNGRKKLVMSNMNHKSRQREVGYFKQFFQDKGYEILYLPPDLTFEGMGDAIPHPEKNLLWGGYGFRTSLNAYTYIAKELEVAVIPLKLVHSSFYHLDTCFLPIDPETVLLTEEAFDPQSLKAIAAIFQEVIAIPAAEAGTYFSLNAHCIPGLNEQNRVCIIQENSRHTIEILQKHGYRIITTDTGEFMKSGGSVFCMKMMYF